MTKRATLKVVHNETDSRFEVALAGAVAVADYRLADNETIVFHHTLVPPELRGQGIAGQLVQAGLDYARDAGLRVVPECSYVARFIDRHPEYQSLT